MYRSRLMVAILIILVGFIGYHYYSNKNLKQTSGTYSDESLAQADGVVIDFKGDVDNLTAITILNVFKDRYKIEYDSPTHVNGSPNNPLSSVLHTSRPDVMRAIIKQSQSDSRIDRAYPFAAPM